MLGKIIEVEGNSVSIELLVDVDAVQSLVNLFVLMNDKNRNYVGEIQSVSNKTARISLVGEFVDSNFLPGVSKKPSFGAKVNLISAAYINKIIGIDNVNSRSEIQIGNSVIYPDVQVGGRVNTLFSNHLAILGSSGSGKSCGFATLVQNLFRKNPFPKNASFVVIDSFGEYETAFRSLSESNPDFVFKNLTTNVRQSQNVVKIPLWLLTLDDLAILLGVKKVTQIPILEKALKYVDVFARKDESILEYKTSIIAKALLEILTSGRAPSQLRDQFISVLSRYNTEMLNLDTPVNQPGYVRPLRQCLLIDESGKIRAMDLIIEFLNDYIKEDIVLKLPDKTYPYSLDDLAYALEFALIDEGILRNEVLYNDIYYIKSNLDSLCNSSDRMFFDYPGYISELDFMKTLLYEGTKKCQILNININYIDDRMAKNISKIFARLLYDFCKGLERRASVPVHIVLEEAHRYVQNDNDVNIIGYNIFDRVAKEGRKYGVLLTLITQRPSELSETSLSQCTNFLLFKMIHPNDVSFIRNVVADITDDTIERIKVLTPGNCILFGPAFKLPTMVKAIMPNPAPMSSSCDVENLWF